VNRVFIIAGTAEQARHLARWHDMAPSEWTYVADAHALLGQRQQTLWLFGTCRERRDFFDLINIAREREFRIFMIEDAQLGEDDWK
jgi:hypothetical protein